MLQTLGYISTVSTAAPCKSVTAHSLLERLPLSLSTSICQFLSQSELPSLHATCRAINEICQQPDARIQVYVSCKRGEVILEGALMWLDRYGVRIKSLVLDGLTDHPLLAQYMRKCTPHMPRVTLYAPKLHIGEIPMFMRSHTPKIYTSVIDRVVALNIIHIAFNNSSESKPKCAIGVAGHTIPSTLHTLHTLYVPPRADSHSSVTYEMDTWAIRCMCLQFPCLTDLEVAIDYSALVSLTPHLCGGLIALKLKVPVCTNLDGNVNLAELTTHKWPLIKCTKIAVVCGRELIGIMSRMCFEAPVVEHVSVTCIHEPRRCMASGMIDTPVVSNNLKTLTFQSVMVTSLLLRTLARAYGTDGVPHTLEFKDSFVVVRQTWSALASAVRVKRIDLFRCETQHELCATHIRESLPGVAVHVK